MDDLSLSERTEPLAQLRELVTPAILTANEEANVGRTLARLGWARRVVVVDSGSTDRTEEICQAAGNVDFIVRPFDSHAQQWSFAVHETGIDTEWVLALDADYVVTDEFLAAANQALPRSDIAGYRCHFVYVAFDKALRGTLYPPVVALYRRAAGQYVQDGHTQRVMIDGPVADLPGVIRHDDRKPLSRWFSSQQRYAALEAGHLRSSERSGLSRTDRLRLMAWPAPFMVFLYVLFAKGCVLDGWPGWFYALQRLLAETMLALELVERSRTGGERDG